MAKTSLTGAALAVLAMVACTPDEMPGPADGRALFMENCAVCHGSDATGGGALADAMSTPPKDLTRISLRNDGRFPRAQILSKIDGYARSDIDGPDMPEFGDLLRGDLVPLDTGDGILTPTPRKLVALLEYLESIQEAR